MERVSDDPVWRFELPSKRALTAEEFQKLSEQLNGLFRYVASVHEMLAHLIKSEERPYRRTDGRPPIRYLVAFFDNGCEIPETLFVFSPQYCQIFEAIGGSVTVALDDGVSRVAERIRSTCQKIQTLKGPLECSEITSFMSRLQVRV